MLSAFISLQTLSAAQTAPPGPDPLAGLADIKLPADSFFLWPLPPGYWLGIALLTGLVVALIYYFHQQKKRKNLLAPLKRLHAQNQALSDQFQRDNNALNFLTGILAQIKLVALLRWGRPQVAHLSGSAWFTFLESRYGKEWSNQEIAALFNDRIYQAPSEDSRDAIDSQYVFNLKHGLLTPMLDDLESYLVTKRRQTGIRLPESFNALEKAS